MAVSALPSETPGDEVEAVVADVFARGCTSRRTMENVTGKWGVLALVALREGAYRFNALRRRVDGVSEKMLAQTLQTLERDGLVRREVLATIPARVEYTLTPLGAEIADQLFVLVELLEARVPQVVESQAHYDATHAKR
ncbi:winged helix-turn-helix transcriptional regulator [Cryptosporangium minutisporangium]|uniref:winged helix-turn-helix transcriptional regulator n=1 Tax=Cryptosporangium minutisporangium TaxID=113569 RepID=UPI0035E7EA36